MYALHQTFAFPHRSASSRGNDGSVDRRIRAFIAGKSHGEDVLDALYGDVADEPVPARLLALLKR
jgi:hypothetical protein